MTQVLETKRLLLRHIELDDAAFIHELMNEPPWIEFIGDRGIHTLADARAFIRDRLIPSYEEHGFGFYLTELREDQTQLGICGLIKRDTLDDVDLGFALFERHWGRGYAREAAEAVIDFARETIGLRRLAAVANPDNERSARLLKTLGMNFERMVRLGDEEQEICFFAREL
jgi:RimJ/RimL family protein N-acetyltransferase